jgi:hypothetical protein
MSLIRRVGGRRDAEVYKGVAFDLSPKDDPRPWQVFLVLEEHHYDSDDYVSDPVNRVARFKTEEAAQDAAFKLHRALEQAPLPGRVHYSEAIFRIWVEVKMEGNPCGEDSPFSASWYGTDRRHARRAYRDSLAIAVEMFQS